MLKSIFLVAVVLAGRVAAADGITQQDQIYVVSGVLGGVCLLLTIAAIVNSVNIIKLQTKVAVLQATTNASSKTVLEAPRPAPPPRPQRIGPSARDNYY